MKKVLNWIVGPLLFIVGLFVGCFARQPKINKLKKQITVLQKQLTTLQDRMMGYQEKFDNLLVQYKGIKVLQLKKKAECEGKLKDNLVLQYGMKEYLTLLLDTVKEKRKFTDEEFVFYKAFDDVIEGKEVNKKDFIRIKEYVLSKHKSEIEALNPCNCMVEFQKISEYQN